MGGNSSSTLSTTGSYNVNGGDAKTAANGHRANGHHGNAAEKPQPKVAYEAFLAGHRAAGQGPCTGVRPRPDAPYEWRTYDQTLKDAMSLGTYLATEFGLKKGSFVGTLCSNCPQLLVLEVACYAFGYVIVPLYDTLGAEACQHILEETRLTVLLCRGQKQLDTVTGLASGKLRTLVVDAGDCGEREDVVSYGQAVARGADMQCVQPPQLSADDLALICYTSGTTGRPKGVMLKNSCLAGGLALVRDTVAEDTFGHSVRLNTSDVYFSYLPVAHILERMCQLFCLLHGASIGFFGGDRQRLMDDLRQCAPTFMAAVPRVISRIYDVTHAGVAGSRVKSLLLSTALAKKAALVEQRQVTRSSLWDRLVLHRVQAALGGRLRFIAIGGAPISPEALRFAKAAFGCAVVQGFGQTETSGLGLCQRPGDPSVDGTGPPMCGVEVKLVDVPDMGYFAEDGHGEVCIRGSTCFAGYYKQQDKTDEVLDSEGWVHTGDIAVVRPDGSYRIVDRAKQMFKLSQGEYVAPEKVEMVYSLSPLVEQVFVDGRSEKSCLVGVVVPDRAAAQQWAQANGMVASQHEQLCSSEEFRRHVLREITELGRQKGLQGFEQVKGLVLHPEPFSAENNLLTPTMKLKRPQLRKEFEQQFDELYSRLEQ